MHEYINLTAENIDNEHICCAIWDPKHQCWVDKKKERAIVSPIRCKWEPAK